MGTSLAFAACAVFVACLDIPDAPDNSGKIQSVEIQVDQFGKRKSTPLKILSSDSAILVAAVSPDTYKNNVRYYWYNDTTLIDSGRKITISPDLMLSDFISDNFVPNRLTIIDNEGNQIEKDFHIDVNAAPRLSTKTIPADGDTLYGNTNTAFTFAWLVYDDSETDTLQSILEIDGISYHVGELNQVQQSGFSMGKHTFRILVQDSYGDMDSLPYRKFYVVDNLEGK